MPADWGSLDRLVARADALAGSWGARARASTTIGQERAILRLFGVHGLDASGLPLAGATIERWLATDPRGLSTGVALPFAVASLEYDLEPQLLAMDVASGAIDLALEGELLRDHDRRALAEVEATRLMATAIERIDAQRTVRSETIGMLGEAPRPWLGVTLREPDVDAALDEATSLIEAGIDLIRIEVPIGRELADLMADAGLEVPEWRPRDDGNGPAGNERSDPTDPTEPAPTGSQRALARLRGAIDRAAARRRAYVRLATVAPALGAPESAVVAAFERIDMIGSDAVAEIIGGAVDPDRSLSDHAFAHRIARHAGTAILVGPGPLVVAPDLSSGIPSDPTTRAGRALALQLLSVTLARGDRLPAEQIIIGALPSWLTEESAPGARAIAEVMVRRALFPGHPLAFVEPPTTTDRSILWPYVQAAAAAHAGDVGLVLRAVDLGPDDSRAAALSARAASLVAADVSQAVTAGPLRGVALDHARGMVSVALETLEHLGDQGWRSVAGEASGGANSRSPRRDTAIERSEPFDPFESLLGSRD